MDQNSIEDVTVLLKRCQDGDDTAREELFVAINASLRGMANRLMFSERADHTLQATGLVNEACMKILKSGGFESLEDRRHLFAIVAMAMQQVLIEHSRKRGAMKRGGDRKKEAMDIVLDRFEADNGVPFTELEESLEKLKKQNERQHQVVTLRFFSGLSIIETAEILEISKSTVESDWRWARAKLFAWLNDS